MATLTFSVDSALLSELGEKLVESAHIALVELVKNAYDADATEVAVRITPRQFRGPDIEIVDNGSGMTLHDVQKYWMRIATTHKRVNNASTRYGRPRTGSKGIGRFSCRRLGRKLQLITVAESEKGGFERTEVTFDWTIFTAGTEISKIECEGKTKHIQSATTGTTLVISGSPTDEWGKRGYDFLKRQLAVLVANRGAKRRRFEPDPGFNVSITAPGFNERIENLRGRLLKAGWGLLTIEVDQSGVATCVLDAMKIGTKDIACPEKFPDLAGTNAQIAIMAGRREEMRDLDVLSKQNLREILEQWGGVYVRYHGFRVYPYGEPGTDWLDIERDRATRKTALSDVLQPFAAKLRGVNPKRALLSLLSEKNYIGDVEIVSEAPGFEMKASREGFVGEAGIRQVKRLVRFGIDWTTMYREYFRSLAAKEESKTAKEELERQLATPIRSDQVLASAMRYVENEVKSVASQLPTLERQQVLKSLKTATQAIEKHEALNREELRHLRLVASTSTLLLIFSHEVKALLSWLEQTSIALDGVQRKIPPRESKRVADIRDQFRGVKERFVDLLSMTSLLSVRRKSPEPARITLLPRVEAAIACFKLVKDAYDVTISTSIPKQLQVGPILEAELYAVMLNALSNALKSVIAGGGRREIEVRATHEAKTTVLHIADSGVGLLESQFEAVFEPFISDPDGRIYSGLDARLNPEDEYVIGTGSGLGLSIAREIVAHRGGEIKFVTPERGWKADLEIRLP